MTPPAGLIGKAGALLAVAKVPVGEHIDVTIGGISFHADTIWATATAGVIVIGLGLWMRSKATAGVPGRLQLFWETVIEWIGEQVESSMGPQGRRVVPLAVTLFVFILIANWLEILPSTIFGKEYLPAPTADVNLTYAIGLISVLVAIGAGIRRRGAAEYLKGFGRPYPFMVLFKVIEEVAKPFTLALRLFGNMFAGGLMVALIAALFPVWLFWVPQAAWKLFDLFIGVIQAFIFALLTVVYYSAATEGGH